MEEEEDEEKVPDDGEVATGDEGVGVCPGRKERMIIPGASSYSSSSFPWP